MAHQAHFLAMNHPELMDKRDLPALEQGLQSAVFASMQRDVAACAERGLLAPLRDRQPPR